MKKRGKELSRHTRRVGRGRIDLGRQSRSRQVGKLGKEHGTKQRVGRRGSTAGGR